MPRLLTLAALVKAAALPEKALRRAEATTRTDLAAAGRTTPCNAMHQPVRRTLATAASLATKQLPSDKDALHWRTMCNTPGGCTPWGWWSWPRRWRAEGRWTEQPL
jgi:hypothetical protein